MNFDQAFDRLIGNEGGYVNNPADPGGETKFGISKRTYPDVDIASLTLEQAKAIYKRDYWDRAKADQYDGQIGFQLFDTAVNSGVDRAIRILQAAVGVMADGKVGPATLAAIAALKPVVVAARMNAERLDFMSSLGSWDHFGRGWAKRIAANLRQLEG